MPGKLKNKFAENRVFLFKRKDIPVAKPVAEIIEIPYFMVNQIKDAIPDGPNKNISPLTKKMMDDKYLFELKMNQKLAKYGIAITDDLKLTTVDKL